MLFVGGLFGFISSSVGVLYTAFVFGLWMVFVCTLRFLFLVVYWWVNGFV